MSEQLPPHQNQNLFGHQEIVTRLKKSYDDGKLHHALIFAGPEGVGKETLAYALIRYALAHADKPGEQPDFRISSEHPAARKVAAQSHPHVFTIQPVWDDKKMRFKRDITLDALDGLTNFLRLMPPEDAPRFIIINPADSLNNNTQNALLKMLEEPPAKTHFLLLTTQLGRLLPTIRSRCLSVPFGPLSSDEFIMALGQLNPELSSGKIKSLYEMSQGALGQALQNEELELLDVYGELCRAVIGWRDDEDSQPAMRFAEAWSKSDSEAVIERLLQIVQDRLSLALKTRITSATITPLIPEEERVLNIWLGLDDVRLLAIYDRVRDIWNAGEAGYLDRKLTLLQILQQLST